MREKLQRVEAEMSISTKAILTEVAIFFLNKINVILA